MEKIHISIIDLIIIILLCSIYNAVSGNGSEGVNTFLRNIVTNRTRGITIDFTPPPIVQEAGSYFILNVSLTRVRIRPVFISLSVYLNLKNEFGRNHTVLIGSKPNIIFPPDKKSLTVTIPCFTTHDLTANINAMFAGETSSFIMSPGWIGVRLSGLAILKKKNNPWTLQFTDIMNTKQLSLWSIDERQQFFTFFEMLHNSGKNNERNGILKFLLSTASSMISVLRGYSPFLIWKKTCVIPAFVCCSKINMITHIENKTDKDGNFNVTVNIANNLAVDVNVLVLVDMSDQSIFNYYLPMFKGQTMYNLGFLYTRINAGASITQIIPCVFPGKGFDKKKYNITVECGPFISIGNASAYGIYFFYSRWQLKVKPYYVVSGKVSNLVQELWFNAPIFYGEPPMGVMFQANHTQILYAGKTSTDLSINRITTSLFDQPLLLLLFIALIAIPYVLIVLLIYVVVQKIMRKKK